MKAEGIKNEKRQNPKENSGFLSILTFTWVLPILNKSGEYFQSLENVFDPLKQDSSELLGDVLEKAWNEEIANSKARNKKPSLLKIFFKTHKKSLIVCALMVVFVEFFLRLLTPVCLIAFIRHFDRREGNTVPEELFYASTAGLVLVPFLSVILMHNFHMLAFHIGMKLRVAITSLIFRKVLILNRSTFSTISTGHIINLLSNDAGRFDFVVAFFFDMWIGPMQICVITYFLWTIMGPNCLVGIGAIILSIPVTVWLAKINSVMRLKTALRTDERVRIMSEIIVGIQVIKMYVWEKPFEKLVEYIRRKELSVITKVSYIRGVLYSLPMFQTRIAIYLTLVAEVLTGNDITASKVFVLTSLVNVMQLTVADYFPQGVSQIWEFLISLKRIENFLLIDCNEDYIKSVEPSRQNQPSETSEASFTPNVSLKDVCVKWSNETRNVLENISFEVKSGELTAIIGPVGAGKSTIFYTILKELGLRSGDLEVTGTVSYASQEPWLFPGSIRENIVFGDAYDEDKFKAVVKACALSKDIDGFIYRENTHIGERGVTLSGGQKARISLARAIYKKADIYLLDDPLSAVDANVQNHLFENCIKGFLDGKIVLLITHQLQFLKDINKIVAIENGMIKCMGNYETLQTAGLDFSIYLRKADDPDKSDEDAAAKPDKKSDDDDLIVEYEEEIVNMEEISKKKMKFNIFWSYFKGGGNICILFTIMTIFILAQVAASGCDYWASFWVNIEEQIFYYNSTKVSNSISDIFSGSYPSQDICIYIFTFFILTNIILTLLRSSLFFSICMRTSQVLHNKMFKAVSRSPLLFFNENPSGRILNRFSKDMGNIDEILPSSMLSCLQIFISAIGVFTVVPTTNVWLIVPTLSMIILFFMIRRVYLNASCVIKRIEGIARSPVYTHLSSSLQGLGTVHALGANHLMNRTFDKHQDRHTATWYTFIGSGRAVALWLDMICAIFNALVTTSFIFIKSSSFGSNVGLAITQTTALTSSLQWGMRQSAEVENQMTSVERVIEYTNLEEEKPFETVSGKITSTSWPHKGMISFRNVSLRYSPDNPWVLNDLSFTIHPSQKVGIVGRTGAGKSSFICALFRLFEVKGVIEIDGVEVTSIGLWDLRSKISVIPQDPVLFTGTLRYNLDPFNEFADDVLWRALEEVELKSYILSLKDGLSSDIHEGGSNLSIGQRQLISLARAIVRGNKILVLDEPTANVDTRTDYFIQETIRKKFKDCTVITIAHRLNSIMDSDIVMVMDLGKIVEFAEPYVLLQNKSGYFYELADQTGCFPDLYAVAAQRFSEMENSQP